MTERQWMNSICRQLNSTFASKRDLGIIQSADGKKLPYRFEIGSYHSDGKPHLTTKTEYQTDLLVFQRHDENSWTPRVIVEGKLGSISTHDALIYSAKAATHRQVHPYLRYGILVGAEPSVPLRLFRHGSDFDFMLTWKSEVATKSEWLTFEKIILEEFAASQKLQRYIETRDRQRDRYSVVRRKLLLER